MKVSKKLRLQNHIKALNKSYENIISILNQDLEEDDDGESNVRGDKVKIFSQGIDEASTTAENILSKIEKKEQELEESDNKKPVKKKEPTKSSMNNHLN